MPNLIVDKFQEIDPKLNRFLGYRFAKNGKTCGEMRCLNGCGRWFSWDIANVDKYILERRWDEKKGEPVHCGNSHCADYHNRFLKHQHKLATDENYLREHTFKLYQKLKHQGVL